MATLNINIDDNVKKQADELFAKLGMTMPTAINLFIQQAIHRNGILFDINLDPFYHPNNIEHLKKTINDYENNCNFSEHELIELDND
jgi:DNA-damage-inducible protein J